MKVAGIYFGIQQRVRTLFSFRVGRLAVSIHERGWGPGFLQRWDTPIYQQLGLGFLSLTLYTREFEQRLTEREQA